MTPAQSELLHFLQNSAPTPAANALLKRTMQQFVLEYGSWYEPIQLPSEIRRATVGECHKNATDLMLFGDSLVYCEGFALFAVGSLPTVHAWVTDGEGHAIDNTWPQPGVAYAGVPFKESFVTMTSLKNRATISLLDDWQNGYPLRGDIGDHPEMWMEVSGHGVRRMIG